MGGLPFPLAAFVVFCTTLASSWCWTVYIRSSAAKHPWRAAVADCGIIGLGMLGVIGYTEDHRLAVPILMAAFIGTFAAVRRP